MDNYTAKVERATIELSAKDRIRIKNFSSAHALDEIVTEESPLMIDMAFYAVVNVHNPKGKDKTDYDKCVIVDNSGEMYVTGSNNVIRQLDDISSEMGGEPFCIEVYKRPSKNYKGKCFMSCNII